MLVVELFLRKGGGKVEDVDGLIFKFKELGVF